MAEKKVQLSKKDRLSVALRSTFLQGSWNYERMQNGGWCFAMIPAIKKLYTTKEDQIAALKRHLEFFNTDRKSTRLNSSHTLASRMPSSA